MSTKIYDAYRIPKNRDILKELKQAKEIAIEMISKDEKYLKTLHFSFLLDVANTLKEDTDNVKALRIKEFNMNGEFYQYDIEFFEFLRKQDNSVLKSLIGVKFSSSIFYDHKFWYIKTYVNYNIQSKILNKIIEELKWEDYHYQDQTDPPENITYRKFKARGAKWDKLLESSGGNYMDGFQYDIFNVSCLEDLVYKFYFTGKPLYDHLAYKFDEIFFKKTNNDEKEE